MNINVKKIIIILLITLIFSIIIFKKYKATDKEYEELYIIQVGAFKNYDNVIKNTKNYENYTIIKENDLYKIFIGITFNDEIYNKLLDLYAKDINVFKKVLKVTDQNFINKIKDYDKVLKNTENKKSIDIIIKAELKELNNLLK